MHHEFNQLVRPLLPELRAFALRLARNHDDADDLLQDVLLRAFRFFDRFEPGTNFPAWIYTIMKRIHLNHYRKRQSIELHESLVDSFDRTSIGNAVMLLTTDGGYEEPFGDEISAALNKLNVAKREMLLMAECEHMPNYEIAERLQKPEGTVKGDLFRARKILQEELREYAAEHGYRSIPIVKPRRIQKQKSRRREMAKAA